MSKKIIGSLVVLCAGALLTTGCPKKETVKSEQPLQAPTTKSAPAPEVVKPTPPSQPSKTESLTETPTKEAAIQPETPKEAIQGTTAENELQKIYFNFDSSDLSQQSRDILSKNAQVLMKNPSMKIRIEGNCDERGSDEYNMALGDRRAKAARDYLVRLGVPADRISVITYGEEKPVDQGHDEAAWAKNRRDEFVIVK